MDDGRTTGPDARPAPARRLARAGGRWLGLTVRTIGVVVTVLLVNLALGWTWDSATGSHGRGPAPARSDRIRFGSAGANHPKPAPPPPDPRATGPAMRPYPWSKAYFRELATAPMRYWPYVGLRNEDYSSRYINQRAGLRRSYEPPTHGATVPSVAFYGASTMWGEGQRDLYTIPSDVARLAQRDGLPIRVENHGIRGVSSWDEALLFESAAAGGRSPELSVFYDGWNDCNLQPQAAEPGQPWEFFVEDMRARLGVDSQPRLVPTTNALRDIWAQYARHSLVHKLVGGLGDLLAVAPAGAATRVRAEPASRSEAPTPTQAGRDCAAVYKRARASILDVATHAGLATRFFWQPLQDRTAADRPFRSADPLIDAPTIDITRSLDSATKPVYLDDGHTNELGAALVAQAIWAHLRPTIAAKYRAGG